MRVLFSIVILCFLFQENNLPTKIMDKPPEYFVLEWKEGTQLTPVQTELFIEVDSLGKQEVVALVNENELPVLYTVDISTPVCADGECKLMNIKLYWTLLGEYAGFDRYPMIPLTKHDHDEFGNEDYLKLHRLLADDKSLLGRRKIDQLVEKPTMRKVNGVDAISGATIARVKESVVSGALYSCYVAWHLVHGNIQDQLKANTLSTMNKQMVIDMLYSINQEYQIFAMENMNISEYKVHYMQIALVFKTSTPLVRSIIAKRLISKYKDTPDLQRPFWEAFDLVDSGSRSLLVKYLDGAPAYVSDILSKKLSAMSKNQLRAFLGYLNDNETVGRETEYNLLQFANSENETYAYLVKEFIEDTY